MILTIQQFVLRFDCIYEVIVQLMSDMVTIDKTKILDNDKFFDTGIKTRSTQEQWAFGL